MTQKEVLFGPCCPSHNLAAKPCQQDNPPKTPLVYITSSSIHIIDGSYKPIMCPSGVRSDATLPCAGY